MTTKLKEVDVVIVGLGWTGGILAKELTEAGMKVVALERGGMRTSENDYSLPPRRATLCRAPRPDAEHRARHPHGAQQSAAGGAADAPAGVVPARRYDDQGLGHQLRRTGALLRKIRIHRGGLRQGR
jgi:choline dehydrogenase-like flavoprotein